jgi:hypothetical protein
MNESQVVAAAHWFDALGRWPNLMQGLGSAIVSGLVAALTAYLVVHLTHRSNMRAATEMDARSAFRDLNAEWLKVISDIQETLDRSPDDPEERMQALRSNLDLVRIRFSAAFNVSFATIALVDREFALDTLVAGVKQVNELFAEATAHAQEAVDAFQLPVAQRSEAVLDAANAVQQSIHAASLHINEVLGHGATWMGNRM